MWSRRGFIKGGRGGAGGAAAARVLAGWGGRDDQGAQAADSGSGGRDDEGARGADSGSGAHERVVIVGAGVAGLAAAAELRGRGVDDVVIVEARGRVGGRIWTGTIGGGVPVELGATWIHGIDGNPVHEIAAGHSIATAVTDYGNEVRYDTSGRELAPVDGRLRRDFMNFAYDLPEMTLLEVFERFAAANGLDAAERHNWRQFLSSMFEHEFGADIADLSILSYDGGSELRGGDVVFPGGYDQIVDAMSPGFDIRLNQPVEMIDHSGDDVSVVTSSGEALEADRVIVTVPLGVLQDGLISFEPGLPARVQQSIDSLAMGVLNRTCLLFEEPFWKPDVEWIGIVGDRPGEWAETLNLYPYLRQPVLTMFNAGSYGAEVEQHSDEQLVELALEALERAFGDVPAPVDSVSTRWRADPWTRGSYSYVPAGASFDSYLELSRPVGDRLFLAGEATHNRYPSTVHGAILSGRRAARQIIGRLNS